jgi:hypothetical protein
MQPYFYILQNIKTGNYYAGAKWAKNADPDKLLIEYKTSSSLVQAAIDDYIIRKIRTFNTPDEAIKYESRFLLKVDAVRNNKFDNMNYGNTPQQLGKKWYNNSIKSTLSYTCPEGYVEGRILNIANLGRYKKSDEHRKKISNSLQGNVPHNKGKKGLQKGTKVHVGKTWKLIEGKRVWMEKDNA